MSQDDAHADLAAEHRKLLERTALDDLQIRLLAQTLDRRYRNRDRTVQAREPACVRSLG